MADKDINGSIGLSAEPGMALLEEEKSQGIWWDSTSKTESKLENRRRLTENGKLPSASQQRESKLENRRRLMSEGKLTDSNNNGFWWDPLSKKKDYMDDPERIRQFGERRRPRSDTPIVSAELPVYTGGEGYRVYVDDLLLPVPPSELELSIQNKNKTMDLVAGGEINILKTPGLSEVKFTALLPNQPYHFALYANGFRNANYFLTGLEVLKVSQKHFPLRVIRTGPGGDTVMDSTSLTVSLEEYTIREDAEQLGMDMAVDLAFKQYEPYGTKTYVLSGDTSATEVKQREVTLTTGQETYTLQEGETLFTLSQKLYGNGEMQEAIYELNKDAIEAAAKADGLESSSNGNVVYAGTELKLPPKAAEQAVATGQNPVGVSIANGGPVTMRSGAVATSGRVITVPSWVKQTGMIASYTNWIEPKAGKSWSRGTNQRRLSDEWKNRGWAVTNSIATLNGYYLIATTTKFGNVGDVVCVYFENGKTLNCIIGDSKGANVKNSPYKGETGNEYGHAYGNSGVDVIEWEYGNRRSGNSQTDADRLRTGLRAMGISGQKVVKMVNYGSWLNQ